jgi:hypothetical protein
MPRYHFHLYDGRRFMDPKGVEFADEQAAREHGARLARGFARAFGDVPGQYIKITNEAGGEVARCDLPGKPEA